MFEESVYPPLVALREAVREELVRKAKLGQKVVVADRDGNPRIYSARYLLRKAHPASSLRLARSAMKRQHRNHFRRSD